MKPLMFDMEFNNYYHSRSQTQLPDNFPKSSRIGPQTESDDISYSKSIISANNGINAIKNGITNLNLDIYYMNNQKNKLASKSSSRHNSPERSQTSPGKSHKKILRSGPENPYQKPVYTDAEQDAEEKKNSDTMSNSTDSVTESDIDMDDKSTSSIKLSRSQSRSKTANHTGNEEYIPFMDDIAFPSTRGVSSNHMNRMKNHPSSAKELSQLRDKLQSKGKLTYSQVMGAI